MNRRVPREQGACVEQLGRRVIANGVLDIGAWKSAQHPRIEGPVRGLVDRRADVVALQINAVDRRIAAFGRSAARQGRKERFIPGAARVELEVHLRASGEDRVESPCRGRLAEPGRRDESDRLGSAADDLPQGQIGLAQREVEGGGFEGPAAVVARRRIFGLHPEQVHVIEPS